MALATRCPACSTIFRISTAQAAAKGGMVRCGQCRNVFNSLDALVRVEDLDIVDEAVAEDASTLAPASGASPLSATEIERTQREPEKGFADSEVSDVLASLSAATEDHSTTHEWWMPDPTGRREPSGSPATDAATAEERRSRESATHGSSSTARSVDGESGMAAADPGIAPASGPDAAPWTSADSGTGPVFMQPTRPVEPVNRVARWTWGILSVVALSLLSAQVAYLERDELAARWSPARPWLVSACSMLRCKVDHPAHAESVTIESVTIQTPAADANLYVLTALLRNRDSIDVRYPYLELVLTDVQDRTVLRRVLRPEDYATPAPDDQGFASPGFAAQSELPVKLTFELDDLRFAGYRLDRFYP